MEAVSISAKLLNFNQTTQSNIPEDGHVRTCSSDNLKPWLWFTVTLSHLVPLPRNQIWGLQELQGGVCFPLLEKILDFVCNAAIHV
jgi:hypothetical protein